MTEGERWPGPTALESPPVVAVSPGLSTRYLMPIDDIHCSKLHIVERGARTYRGYLLSAFGGTTGCGLATVSIAAV
jgi:hypothetical protein